MADMKGWQIPENVKLIKVADINDPSAELNLESGSESGMMVVCYEAASGTNEVGIYIWDDASSEAESIPFTVDGSAGIWIAAGGKYSNTSAIIPSDGWVYFGLETVDGSVRIGVDNNVFVIQHRELGTWVEKWGYNV